jgi:hypothetical protein
MRSAAATKSKAKNSLANLSRSCSTDRVLNLTTVHREFRDTPEYAQSPLFRNARLNKSIFLKHTLRIHERERRDDGFRQRMTVTKVILPFDTADLTLGGFSCFINDNDIERTIASQFGSELTSESFRRDMQVLRIMDTLPTFDPFLLRERLKRDGMTVARCYFDLSEADATRMREYVQSEIQKIVRLALNGENGLLDQASNMTHKLMTDETASSLEPLRRVLQLSGEEWRDGVFAWKGFLYYSWNIDATTKFMPELQRQLLEAKVKAATSTELKEIDAIRRRISCCLTYLHGVATDGVNLYRQAYKDLLEGKPRSFQEFLQNAPARFLEVGEAFGMIMHLKSFWQFRFKTQRGTIPADEALEIFRDLDLQFAAIYEKLD